jgi:hypothetical protein
VIMYLYAVKGRLRSACAISGRGVMFSAVPNISYSAVFGRSILAKWLNAKCIILSAMAASMLAQVIITTALG